MSITHSFFMLLSVLFFGCDNPTNNSNAPRTKQQENTTIEKPTLNLEATRLKAVEALAFCKSKKFNEEFCILIDMSKHSGIKRFIVWDFNKDSIMHRFLVAHGCGDYSWSKDMTKENPRFSNTAESHCSSLGKYKIGGRSPSEWGVFIKYDLHGLENSNDNALSRYIVLHSWEAISDEEIYPKGTPEGYGCPAISNNSLLILDPLLKSSKKPVLMWMYQ